jgi:hypothetical protein
MPGAWDRVGAAVAWPLANSLVTVLRHPALWFSLSGAFAAYLCALFSLGAPPLPLIYPDSTTYWRAYSIVPLGYPAVIHALYAATGTLKSIIVFQIVAFCTSVLTLQAGVNALTRNAPLAGILALLLLGYHGLAFNSLVMLTEALFTAVLLLHVASAAFAMARDSKIGLVGMAFTAVIAVSLRPSGYFLFGGIILLTLGWRGRRALVARWAIAPLILFTAIFVTIGLAVRGIATQAFTGIVVFPHVAYLYDGGGDVPPETERQLLKAIEPFRVERGQRIGWSERAEYERANYGPVTRAILDVIKAGLPGRDDNDVTANLARHTIARHPVEYAMLATRATVYGFFLVSLTAPRFTAADLQSLHVNAERPRYRPGLETAMGAKFAFDPKSDHSKYFLLTRYPIPQIGNFGKWRFLLLAWAGLATMASWAMVLLGSRTSPRVVFTAYVSGLLVGAYALMGLSTAIISRYGVPLDALLIVTMVMGTSIWSGGRGQDITSPANGVDQPSR